MHEDKLTDGGAFANMMKGMIGISIIIQPLAFSWSGWVLGALLTIIQGQIVWYICYLTMKVCQIQEITPNSYVNFIFHTIGEGAGIFACILLIIGQVATCIVYTMFFINYFQMATCYYEWQDLCQSRVKIGIITAVLIFPLTFLNSMHKLRQFCIYALILIFTALAGIVYYSLTQIFDEKREQQETKMFDFAQIPITLGIINGVFECCAIYFEVRCNMVERLNFTNVMHWVINVATLIILVFAVTAHFAFGLGVKEFVILELPLGNAFYTTLLLFYCLQLIVSYSLMIFPVSAFLVRMCFGNPNGKHYHPLQQHDIQNSQQDLKQKSKKSTQKSAQECDELIQKEHQLQQNAQLNLNQPIQDQIAQNEQQQPKQNQNVEPDENNKISDIKQQESNEPQQQQSANLDSLNQENQKEKLDNVQEEQGSYHSKGKILDLSMDNDEVETEDQKYMYLIIFFINIFVFVVAYFIENTGMFISFNGSLFSTFMTYIFPLYIYTKYLGHETGICQHILNGVIAVYGIIMGVIGCFESGQELINDLKSW